jgi:hypothetical protein
VSKWQNLWKPDSVLFSHPLVVSVPLLREQGAASLHASVPSAKGCYILFVFILDDIGSPVAVQQLDAILVFLWLALVIQSLSVEFKCRWIRGLTAQFLALLPHLFPNLTYTAQICQYSLLRGRTLHSTCS